MKVELNKKDLISLVNGTIPYFGPMYEFKDADPFILSCGQYNWKIDIWEWDYEALSNLTEEELFHLYKLIRD